MIVGRYDNASNPGITRVSRDTIWMKQPTRHIRDDPDFSYVDLYVAESGMQIAIHPVSGQEVTGESYKVVDGRIDAPEINRELGLDLPLEAPSEFWTWYHADDDRFVVDLSKPSADSSKHSLLWFIRQQSGLDGSNTQNLAKEEMIELFDCEDQFDLIDALESELDDEDYSVNIAAHINKSGYVKLARSLSESETD